MNFVVIKYFDDYISAHLAMGKLKEENIQCYLQDENTSTIAPFLTFHSGGIKLLVPEPLTEMALRIINNADQDTVS